MNIISKFILPATVMLAASQVYAESGCGSEYCALDQSVRVDQNHTVTIGDNEALLEEATSGQYTNFTYKIASQPVDADGKAAGVARVNSDGHLVFDTNDEFKELDDGAKRKVSFEYSIQGAEVAAVEVPCEGEECPEPPCEGEECSEPPCEECEPPCEGEECSEPPCEECLELSQKDLAQDQAAPVLGHEAKGKITVTVDSEEDDALSWPIALISLLMLLFYVAYKPARKTSEYTC